MLQHLWQTDYIGASIVRKHMNIIVDVLSDERTLFIQYICILLGNRLQHMIDRFQFTCGFPNIASAIDGTHIPLARKPNRHDTLVFANFYCARKRLNFVALKLFVTKTKKKKKKKRNIWCNMFGSMTNSGVLVFFIVSYPTCTWNPKNSDCLHIRP